MGYAPPDSSVDKPKGPVDNRRFSTVPPIWISGMDRVPDIETALSGLNIGNFRQPALLADAAMRDDRIWAVLDTRAGVIRGADVEVKPANASAKAAELATLIGGDDTAPGMWDDLVPSDLAGNILQYGWLNAVCASEIIWQWVESLDMHLPRLRPIHPQFIYWDWGYRAYRCNAFQEGTITLPDVMTNPYGDGKFFVWFPFGYQYAWRQAMIKPLADLYMRRRWNARDWARYNEKHGSIVDIAYVPDDADEADKEAFFNDIVMRGADTAVMVPRRDGQSKDSGYGLDTLEPKGKNWETFVDTQEKLDNSIAIMFWGQNLTTEIGKGAGSKAAEQGHQKVAEIKSKEDAKLAVAYRQQVLSWWAHHNFGDADLAPRVRYVVEPPTDLAQEGAGLLALGQAAAAMKAANPKTDVDALWDTHGIAMLTEAEVAEEQRQKLEQAQAMKEAMTPPPAPGDKNAQNPNGGGGSGGSGGGGGAGPDRGKGAGGEAPAGAGASDKKGGDKKAALKNDGAGVVDRRMFAGFKIAIENKAGSIRKWHDPDGNETGSTTMSNDYGFFEDFQGMDGEELDVYLGPDENAADVHIVKQMKLPDYAEPDEQKVLLGFADQATARAAYVAHRNDGSRAVGSIITMPMNRFREQLKKRPKSGEIGARDGGTKVATLRADARHLAGRTKRRKIYADAVAERGRQSAKKAMASSLHRVLAAIKGAHGYDDLKKRLLHEFKSMRPDEFAKVVEKARIMAKAGGMDSAWQQV
jgi:phage gp29-like protein/inorganic pyrophosphatase